jgi:hypothetical protein
MAACDPSSSFTLGTGIAGTAGLSGDFASGLAALSAAGPELVRKGLARRASDVITMKQSSAVISPGPKDLT